MTLRETAEELSKLMRAIADSAGGSSSADISQYADSLDPGIRGYDNAVFVSRSRAEAQEHLNDLVPLVADLNQAATKGELHEFPPYLIDRFFELHTIFRESRFAGEEL
jgi:hypothetical protein